MISVNTKRIKDMGTLRYVKTPAELQEAAENNLEFFDATMQAVKVFYKTTPGLIEQLIPAPLTVADDPMVRIVMSRVFVDLHDGLEFGAATFGAVSYTHLTLPTILLV